MDDTDKTDLHGYILISDYPFHQYHPCSIFFPEQLQKNSQNNSFAYFRVAWRCLLLVFRAKRGQLFVANSLMPVILRQIINDNPFVGIINWRAHAIDHLADGFFPADSIQKGGVLGDVVQAVTNGTLGNDLVFARPLF
jgi:hypothetical protein